MILLMLEREENVLVRLQFIHFKYIVSTFLRGGVLSHPRE
jgi:hypothetical protein